MSANHGHKDNNHVKDGNDEVVKFIPKASLNLYTHMRLTMNMIVSIHSTKSIFRLQILASHPSNFKLFILITQQNAKKNKNTKYQSVTILTNKEISSCCKTKPSSCGKLPA